MSKIYDEKLENYLRGLVETLMRKYSFSKKEAARIIMSSYVWPSFLRFEQFIAVVHGAIAADGKDPFYLEEDEMMKYINKFKG